MLLFIIYIKHKIRGEDMEFYNLKEKNELKEVVGKRVYKAFIEGKKDMTLEDVMDRLDQVETIVAVEDNECLGSVAIFENDLTSRQDLTPWLASLVVEPKYRSKKVGAQLMDQVKAEVKRQGYDKVYLRTGNAHEYYLKRGWKLVEMTTDEGGNEIGVYEFSL